MDCFSVTILGPVSETMVGNGASNDNKDIVYQGEKPLELFDRLPSRLVTRWKITLLHDGRQVARTTGDEKQERQNAERS